jgi:hypothetical protein
MVFYSAIKKNGILSFAGKQVELENIMLSEISYLSLPPKNPGITCFLSFVGARRKNQKVMKVKGGILGR